MVKKLLKIKNVLNINIDINCKTHTYILFALTFKDKEMVIVP